jgi:hypothetical protein
MTSSARWKDGELAIDSVVRFPEAELRLNDVWTLSPEGQTLTIVDRHQFGKEPGGEMIIVYEKQVNATWEPPAPPKPAEEVIKNIQVLKGLPATELRPMMLSFGRALVRAVQLLP